MNDILLEMSFKQFNSLRNTIIFCIIILACCAFLWMLVDFKTNFRLLDNEVAVTFLAGNGLPAKPSFEVGAPRIVVRP